ncbi:hypothetical protein [Calycomorphotria hydatis]|uniref:Uncharacterized protein n=1 Tax=Calycomorphotria hydatis TaxID=2528027 RepID=A0A517T4F9_9PLAN|nr:hypothetical protein [Calycomorphotria hydatis]QDT63270.1 hypothetical protein V22_04890 [Calycomorphotria hydatis]
MISRSRRNHPTTRRNTLRKATRIFRVATTAATEMERTAQSACVNAESGSLDFSRGFCLVFAIGLLMSCASMALAQDSGRVMLDRLRDRDAESRWHRAAAAHPYQPESSATLPSTLEIPGNGGPQLAPAPTPYLVGGAASDNQPLRTAQLTDEYGLTEDVEGTATTPEQLMRITEILPYWNYNPNPNDDPCLYLCPRPGEEECPPAPGDQYTPACPDEVTLSDQLYPERMMPGLCFYWTPTNNWYQPLYFQDVKLERYGHSYGDLLQPGVCVGLFAGQLIGLPYQMGLDPPWKKEYTLGYYQPGEPAPKLSYQVPLNARAAAMQAGVVSGIGVILP